MSEKHSPIDAEASRKNAPDPDEAVADGLAPGEIPSPTADADDIAAPEEGPETPLGEDIQDILNLGPEGLLDLKKRAEERDLLREEILRARADLDNHQKRVRRERPNWEDQAVRGVIGRFLPVLDNFELALTTVQSADVESLRMGIQMIYQLLITALEEIGVEEVRIDESGFDPDLHEAVATREVTDREDNEILEVQQKGYLHKGLVIRPSRVTVAKKIAEAPSESSE